MAKQRRPRAKRGEGERLRDEILDVADRLLLETGSESAVSIQMIADGVGCTPPAIYLHFADKDALMYEVSARHFESFVAALEKAGPDDGDPIALLRSRGRAYVEYGIANPEPYRIVFLQWSRGSANRGADAAAEAFRAHTALVEDCIERGLLPAGDPFTLSCVLWAAIHGITSLLIANPDYPWPPLDDMLDALGWVAAGPGTKRRARSR